MIKLKSVKDMDGIKRAIDMGEGFSSSEGNFKGQPLDGLNTAIYAQELKDRNNALYSLEIDPEFISDCNDPDTKVLYVVLSYFAPIAWRIVTTDKDGKVTGGIKTTHKKYSPTTSKAIRTMREVYGECWYLN